MATRTLSAICNAPLRANPQEFAPIFLAIELERGAMGDQT